MPNRTNLDRDDLSDRLQKLFPNGTIEERPVSQFEVTYNVQTKGVNVKFTLVSKRGIFQIALKRAFSLDEGAAVVLQTWNANAITTNNVVSYDDLDPDIPNQSQVSYWLHFSPILDGDTSTVGPQTLLLHLDQGETDAIKGFAASHAAGAAGKVVVSVTFDPPDNANFGSCKIYIAGYLGVADFVAIAQPESSPASFTLEETGESVTLEAVAVSQNAIESSATAPTASLTLNSTLTVPCKPFGVTALELTTGVQVTFPANPEAGLTRYDIYRAVKGLGSGAASSIGTVSITSASSFSYLDTTGLAGRFGWFVRAVNGAGNGSFSDEANTEQFNSSADITTVNATGSPTSMATLANDGVSHVITISAFTQKYPFGNVSYNSGSVDPGVFGTFYIYADDPNYTGGAVTYQFTTDYATANSGGESRVYCGGIVTSGGAAGTGGGSSGGSAGTGGGTGGGHGALP